MSELLSQLQDWNNRRQFMSADDFHLQEARSETFVSQIRISFVNEFGVEEAGIDGGGIFKDFMENIIQAAFDVQYGLFKVCGLVLHLFVVTNISFSLSSL
ncbi:hypothetical protein B296_00055245 [Ensete ventricosum]|uniref:HECT-type E3 ubiquitin transferase n=1 Tax=Ensete ventricosum TaxID=4639 RepID=A0A426XN67_ENSVE|nr:hypothetical protein B296_00055245 [Ensete ventricosum]